MSSKIATKTKLKTSVKNKVAVGMMAAGAVALAAAAVIGGKKSALSISKVAVSSSEIYSNSKEVEVAKFSFSAGDKDIELSSFSMEIFFKSNFQKNKNLVKELRLFAEDRYCYIVPKNSYGYSNNKVKPGNYYCTAPVQEYGYGYNKLSQIGRNGSFAKLFNRERADFVFSNKFIIPSGQTRTIFVKADVGEAAGGSEFISVSIPANAVKANYIDQSKAAVKITKTFDQWKKIINPVVLNLPDLIIEKVDTAGKSSNQKIQRAHLYIKNIGDEIANIDKNAFIEVYSGKQRFSKTPFLAGKIKPGETYYQLATFVVSDFGEFDINFSVDTENKVKEKNESNNSFSAIIKVEKESVCNETDYGKDYYREGKVYTGKFFGDTTEAYADICTSGNYIAEYYCKGKNIETDYFNCPNGCASGRCK